MPTIYENEGHRRSSMKNFHRLVWRLSAWRADPCCRKCKVLTHNEHFNPNWKQKATLDHHVCRALGGSDTEENFVLLCSKCNQAKSKAESKIVEYYRKQNLDPKTFALTFEGNYSISTLSLSQ